MAEDTLKEKGLEAARKVVQENVASDEDGSREIAVDVVRAYLSAASGEGLTDEEREVLLAALPDWREGKNEGEQLLVSARRKLEAGNG